MNEPRMRAAAGLLAALALGAASPLRAADLVAARQRVFGFPAC